MKARILALLTVIVLLVAATVIMTYAETPPDYTAALQFEDDGVTAYCAVCNADKVWEEVTAETSLPIMREGHKHYYLNSDFTTEILNVAGPVVKDEGSWFYLWIKGGTVCFHLNGHNITTSGNVHMAAGKFNLLGSGSWTSNYVNTVDTQPRGTVVHLHNTSAIANLYSGSLIATTDGLHPVGIHGHPTGVGGINIFGTTVQGGVVNVGGTINLKGGTIKGRSELRGYYNTRSSTWYKPVFNMTAGTVTGLGVHKNEYGGTGVADGNMDGDGGAFILKQGATLSISGGTVTGGVVKSQGGAIYACAAVKDTTNNVTPAKCVVNISGTAVVQGGFSWNYGGNLYMEAGTELNISGGTIKTGTACVRGGNIAAYAGAVINMTGGTLSSGNGGSSATTHTSWGGGNIYSNGATLNLTKGLITAGTTKSSGGNIFADNSGTVPSSVTVGADCTIQNGESKQSAGYAGGGNIYIVGTAAVNSTLEIAGKLVGGTAGRYGGSIYASHVGITLKPGSSVTGGSATTGGNINKFNTGNLTVEAGALISNGVASGNGGNVYISEGRMDIAGTVSQTALPEGKTYNAIEGGNIYATVGAGGAADIHITGTVDGGISRKNGGAFLVSGGADVTVQSTGVIKNGYAIAHTDYSDRMGGGNVYMYGSGSSLTLNGGQIIDGSTDFCGGNVHTSKAGCTFTMNNGIVKGGTSSNSQDNVRLSADSTMNFMGGTVYGTKGGVAGKGTAIHVNNAELYLAGEAKTVIEGGQLVSHIYLASNGGNLRVLDGWSGSTALAPRSLMDSTSIYGTVLPRNTATNYVACGKMVDNAFVMGGSYTGTIYYEYDALLPEVFATSDGTMYVSNMQLVKADNSVKWTSNPAADFATGNYKYVKCYGGELTLNGDLVADINGKLITVNGTGKLSAFDSANKNFTATNRGFLTVNGDVQVQPAMKIDGMQYVALTHNSGKITFHRIEATIKNVALRLGTTLDNVGYYYQAVYKFDDMLKEAIDSYGVVLSKINAPGNDFMSEPKGENGWTAMTAPLTSGELVNSGLLKNIMKVSNEAQVNQRNGEMPVFAKPYIVLNMAGGDVTVLAVDTANADGVAMSLKDVLVAIDDYWNNFEDQTVKTRMKEFYSQWASKGMSAWAPELKNMSAAN